MIYSTPISSYNMQNAQQLGQMMQDQAAYTPSINPFSSHMAAPPGYSLYQWQQELSLARQQYITRPLLSGLQLGATSLGSAMLFAPVMREMVPEAVGGKVGQFISKSAFGFHNFSHAMASGAGRTFGEAFGWAGGQLGRGAFRVGEATTNYIFGGAFTSANEWLGETTGKLFGAENSFKFGKNLSGYVDDAAGWMNRSLGELGAMFSDKADPAVKAARSLYAKELRAARAAGKTAEEIKALRELKYAKLSKTLSSGFTGANNLAGLSARVLGTAGSVVGAFFSPAFLLKQAVIDKAIDYGTEAYENYNTRIELNREILAKGGRILRFGDAGFDTGIDGGFTKAQRQHLVSFIDRMAANDYTVRRNDWFGGGASSIFGGHTRYTENLKELKALLSVSTDMGMLDMSKSLDEVEKRFANIVKVVKQMSRITGKSKGELAMALASTQQSEGRFNIADAAASLQRKIYAATASGASLQTILQESAMGAQMGFQAGIGKAAGADFMTLSRNMYGRMYRRGMLDRGDIDMMGGEQGVVSTLASGMISMTNNNVFKSQLAMFFDRKTGGINKEKMQRYLNGDDKSLRNSMLERHIAMSTTSYNSMTGMMEIGGEINAAMPFVTRALQHGDISQRDMLRMSRKFMREAELVYGVSTANRMMSSFFINNFGADQGMLLMRAMRDESLLKPDLKEQMAVTRKQVEDRYKAEYEKATAGWGVARFMANGGWGMSAALGLMSLAGYFKTGAIVGSAFGPVGTLIGAGVGLLAGAGISAYYGFDNKYLTSGTGAMSLAMGKIDSHGANWWNRYWYNDRTGLQKYKDSIRDYIYGLNKIDTESMLKTAKASYGGLKKVFSPDNIVLTGGDLDNYSRGLFKSTDKEIERYLLTGEENIDFSGFNKNEVQRLNSLDNKSEAVRSLAAKILLDNPEVTDESQAIKLAAYRLNKVSLLGGQKNVILDTNNNGRELITEYIYNKGKGLRFKKITNTQYSMSTNLPTSYTVSEQGFLHEYRDLYDLYVSEREKGLESALMRRLAGEEASVKYWKDKGLKGIALQAAWRRDNGSELIKTLRNYKMFSNAPTTIGEDGSIDLESVIDIVKSFNKFDTNESSKKFEKMIGYTLRRELANDMNASGTIKIDNYLNSSNMSEVVARNSFVPADEKKPEESVDGYDSKDSDVATGSSALNRELINVLKGLKSTMDSMNVRLGAGTERYYVWN